MDIGGHKVSGKMPQFIFGFDKFMLIAATSALTSLYTLLN